MNPDSWGTATLFTRRRIVLLARKAFLALDAFLNLSALTDAVTQIEELCASDLTGTDNVNLGDEAVTRNDGYYYRFAK